MKSDCCFQKGVETRKLWRQVTKHSPPYILDEHLLVLQGHFLGEFASKKWQREAEVCEWHVVARVHPMRFVQTASKARTTDVCSRN